MKLSFLFFFSNTMEPSFLFFLVQVVYQISKTFLKEMYFITTHLHEDSYSGFDLSTIFLFWSFIHYSMINYSFHLVFLYRQLSWGSVVWLRMISSLKFSMEWHLQVLFQKEVLPIDPVISLMRYSSYQMNALFTDKIRLVIKSWEVVF